MDRLPTGFVPWLAQRIIRATHRWPNLIPYRLYLWAGDVWIDRYIKMNRD